MSPHSTVPSKVDRNWAGAVCTAMPTSLLMMLALITTAPTGKYKMQKIAPMTQAKPSTWTPQLAELQHRFLVCVRTISGAMSNDKPMSRIGTMKRPRPTDEPSDSIEGNEEGGSDGVGNMDTATSPMVTSSVSKVDPKPRIEVKTVETTDVAISTSDE
eukprot:scaffold4549_cov136-Isochrysis_galbana.AAC.3